MHYTTKNMLVQNLKGTADNPAPAPYSSWIEYWEKATGEKARICHRLHCLSTQNLVGAHVKLDKSYEDNRWWIVPLCQSCNCKQEEFEVEGPLAWVGNPSD